MDLPHSADQEELDTKVLSRFIYEMNITRRYVLSYPSGHPVVESSIWKVLQSLEQLLHNQDSITIGVARNALMVSQGILDHKNPVYRDLAAFLFSRNIATISFSRELTDVEFATFIRIINGTPESIRAGGGIARLLGEADVRNIVAAEIDYGSFLVTEEDAVAAPAQIVLDHQGTALWGKFVQGMLDGNLDPAGAGLVNIEEIEPEQLADFLNDHEALISHGGNKSYEQAITQFMRQLDSEEIESQADGDTINKMGEFVRCLSPELRRQFLRSSFESFSRRQDAAGEPPTGLPDDLVMDSIEDVSIRGSHLSQGVMNLLQFISKAAGSPSATPRQATRAPLTDEELGEKLRSIFREDEPDRYIPEEYQATLKAIAAVNRIPVLTTEESESLRRELTGYQVETHVSDVILEILDQDLELDEGAVLQRNLLEFCELFLETGDFRSLAKIHLRLSRQCSGPSYGLLPIHENVLSFFMRTETTTTVLDGLTVWGKAKYEDIQALIGTVGAPFVEPLFQRLADEKTLSLRRYYMERLQELGTPARTYALQNLKDKRWYVVRNCIVLLRNLGDPSVLGALRQVIDHPHVRVRQEVVRTLVRFEHPAVNRLILREMGAADPEMQRFAVQIAGQRDDPLIFQRLRAIVTDKAMGDADLELKVTAVKALARIGNPAIVPDLLRILETKSILRPVRMQRFKEEIVRTLESYPYDAVMPVISRMEKSDNPELAAAAARVRTAVEAHRYGF